MGERRSLTCLLIMRFLVQGKRSLHRDPCNLTVLHVFDVGELGARRFPGPKWVRAKDAKDAKVRKAIAGLSFDHTGWWACGVAGGSGLSEPDCNGGGR